MSERSWKWFKHGWQFDIAAKAIDVKGNFAKPAIVVFTETKDKQEARKIAVEELAKYGYMSIEVCKIVPRF